VLIIGALGYQQNLRVWRFGGETPPGQPAGTPAFRSYAGFADEID